MKITTRYMRYDQGIDYFQAADAMRPAFFIDYAVVIHSHAASRGVVLRATHCFKLGGRLFIQKFAKFRPGGTATQLVPCRLLDEFVG